MILLSSDTSVRFVIVFYILTAAMFCLLPVLVMDVTVF